MKTLLIDNYDSFTFNVYQYLRQIVGPVTCVRNDKMTLSSIETMSPDLIVISPGPKSPQEAGICIDIVKKFAGSVPIFGICLGHQIINEAFGGETVHAKELVHGKTSEITSLHKGSMKSFDHFTAARYHSLAVSKSKLPDCLEVTCETEDGEIMGIRHKKFLIEGVQFHPESVMTIEGMNIMRAFIDKMPSFKMKL